MNSRLDIERLAARVRARRGNRTLRAVVQDIPGVSLSTLSRVEQGKMIDVATFLYLCDWLVASPQEFITNVDTMNLLSPMAALEPVEVLLRSNACYSDEFVDALMQLLRVLGREKEREI